MSWTGRRTILAAMAAGLVLTLCPAGAALAADVAGYGHGPHPPYGPRDLPVPAIVVPGCEESFSATLMRCVPRREIAFPDEVELLRIERSLGPRGPLPYKQLFTWP